MDKLFSDIICASEVNAEPCSTRLGVPGCSVATLANIKDSVACSTAVAVSGDDELVVLETMELTTNATSDHACSSIRNIGSEEMSVE
eukprot:ANDGO_04135.mRNA.1 hypothetical protein